MASSSYLRRLDVFKSDIVKGAAFSNKYEFPIIKSTDFKPYRAIPFDKSKYCKDYNQWVHFYIDDYLFEKIWNCPEKYLSLLKQFEGVITPDFSLYYHLPICMQIWNTYRNRAMAYWLQMNNINIIPNVRWGNEKSYDFCFEAIEKGATIATSTNGCIKKDYNRHVYKKGLYQLIDRISPKTIVIYSQMPRDLFQICFDNNIELINIENYHTSRKRGLN